MIFKNVLFKVATMAGKFQLEHFGKLRKKDIHYKKHREFVTYVDKYCGRLITAEIRKYFPGQAVVSEEAAVPKVQSGYTWYIDPLDGTTNYSIGHPIFAVALAVGHAGETVESLVYLPFLKQYYYAKKGAGAFLNGRRIRVSTQKNLSKSVVAINIPHSLAAARKSMSIFGKVRPRVANIRVFGSCSYSASMAASGRIDAVLMPGGAGPWDIKPGRLLVSEAGGSITDFYGRQAGQASLLLSNGKIHSQLVNRLK